MVSLRVGSGATDYAVGKAGATVMNRFRGNAFENSTAHAETRVVTGHPESLSTWIVMWKESCLGFQEAQQSRLDFVRGLCKDRWARPQLGADRTTATGSNCEPKVMELTETAKAAHNKRRDDLLALGLITQYDGGEEVAPVLSGSRVSLADLQNVPDQDMMETAPTEAWDSAPSDALESYLAQLKHQGKSGAWPSGELSNGPVYDGSSYGSPNAVDSSRGLDITQTPAHFGLTERTLSRYQDPFDLIDQTPCPHDGTGSRDMSDSQTLHTRVNYDATDDDPSPFAISSDRPQAQGSSWELPRDVNLGQESGDQTSLPGWMELDSPPLCLSPFTQQYVKVLPCLLLVWWPTHNSTN